MMTSFHNEARVDFQANVQNFNAPIHYDISDKSLKRPDYDLGLHLFNAPDIDDGLFIGRTEELEQMQKTLLPDSASLSRRLLILGGVGGIGKTQLAIQYAKKFRSSYDSIFWFDATSEDTLKASFDSVSNVVLEAKSINNNQQTIPKVLKWFCEKANKKWLIILDNHDDPEAYKIDQYFPSASHGSILMTTRLPELMRGHHIKIPALSLVDDGLHILETRSTREGVISDPDAKRLAKRLNGFPLALATAGAYLKFATAVSFQDYLKQYEAKWKISSRGASSLPEYTHNTLYTTWDISFERLRKEHLDAAQTLKFLAYLSHQNIWYELFHGEYLSNDQHSCQQEGQQDAQQDFQQDDQHDNQPNVQPKAQLPVQLDDQPAWFVELSKDKFAFTDIMATLANYCFIEVDPRGQSYSMHICVHDWALDGLNKRPDPHLYRLAFKCVVSSMGHDNLDNLGATKYEPIAAHAAWLANAHFDTILTTGFHDQSEHIDYMAKLLHRREKYTAAERMYRQVLKGYEKTLGMNDPLTLNTVHNIGNAYADQNKLVEAEQMYKRALEGTQNVLGPDHASTLDTVHALGLLYFDQDKLPKAREMYERVLIAREKYLGPNDPSTLRIVHDLGNLYAEQENLDEAENMYNRVINGTEVTLGQDSIAILGTLNALAQLYADQGKYAEAEKMFQKSLTTQKKVFGHDHTSTLRTIHNLGNLFADQGKLIEAEQMYQQALTGKEMALGPDHISTLGTLQALGVLYVDQGRLAEAEKLYERTLTSYEKMLPSDSTLILLTMNNFGNLYKLQGKLSKAERMYQQAMDGYEKTLGPNHTSTLRAVHDMANFFKDQGKLDQAEELCQRALNGTKIAPGPNHTLNLHILNSLGNIYREQGKPTEAEQTYQQAFTGYEKTLGTDHTSTLGTVYSLGKLYADQDKLVEAETMYQRALTGYNKVVGEDHSLTLDTKHQLELVQEKLKAKEQSLFSKLLSWKF